MVGGARTSSSTSSPSTWISDTRTNGTWAVRPVLTDSPQDSTPQASTSSSYRPNDSTTLLSSSNAVSPRNSSPVVESPSFQWVRGDLIGEGSYGRVFWAFNVTTGDIIAVKQVGLARSPSKRERESIEALMFESITLKELDHPNIVQFLGFEKSTDHISIFMEYVSGGTIGSCLKAHGRFDDEVTKAFARQMIEGLDYLHSRGIIHRDIKSDNILVEKLGVCKISDFGISKQAENIDGRAFTGMKGSVYWMAPEAVDSKDGYNSKVDIWSIGCVVLEMWTGRRPWHGEDLFPVMFKLARQKVPPPIPTELLLSDEAMDFRDKVFARDPEGRPSAATLRSHPYLVMLPNWTFKPTYIEGPGDGRETEHSIRHAKSHPSMPQNPHRIRSKKSLPPVPVIPPVPSTIPPVPHNYPLGAHPNSSSSSQSLSDSPGPPIVVIKPLSSPARSNPQQPQSLSDGISSPSTSSLGRFSARPKRSFHITNPDPVPEEEPALSSNRRPFVYRPPPLPVHDHGPRRVPSTPVLRTQTTSTAMSRSRHFSSTVGLPILRSNSDDDTGTGTSVRRPLPKSASTGNKRESAWERPYVEDIYEHLQEFFPNHDIDKPIVDEVEGPLSPWNADDRTSGLRWKKSIRMVAEQQVKRSQSDVRKSRRATKLWGSHLQELDGV